MSQTRTMVEVQPPGMVAYFANSSAPAGWLKCNGAAVSRTTYSALFAAVGTTYGAGDGSTTFNVPDMRGEFLRSLDDGRGVDTGRVVGTAQLDAMQGHRHDSGVTAPSGRNLYGNARGAPSYADSWNTAVGHHSGWTGGPETDNTNGTPRTATETRPRNIALLGCIKF